jgi:WXXGXW repeat (2 copies)
MKKLISSTLLLLVLSVGLAVSAANAQVAVGIRIGPPPAPRVVAVTPARPGPEFVWIDGYWYPSGGHYRWHAGYWTRPPYAGAHWVGPHHDGQQYFAGYWDGDHGKFDHDHHWDRDNARDYNRYH